MTELNYKYYLGKANEVLHVLQAEGFRPIVDYSIVIGLVVKKMIQAAVENGEDREKVVRAFCEAIREMGKE